ncbi:hypothetical protein RclHR1_11050006 [Rhizophagus clarus]|uniref:Uncharacterized protein n=1 Tax=Rhizophagus clarus TaxID=94130 RepID=A0A2Z6QFH9_9GLOM|nr:hypothetical protein RclHR1_11050006 [Rhizophagus clarus]
MKALTLTLLLLLSITCLTLIKEIKAQCYDYTNALDISVRTPIACNIVNNIKGQTPPSPVASPPPPSSSPLSAASLPPSSSLPLSSSLTSPSSLPPPSSSLTPSPSSSLTTSSSPLPSASVSPPASSPAANVTNNFIINYKCEIETNQELCTKAQQSIEKVCEILSSNLNLITNIDVDVTLSNLCPTNANQPCSELGGATFARTMELLDDDNVIREYPTTLVKQFDCERHYEFGDVDIRAVFNGGNATSLWFEGDPQITSDQKDFRLIVLKEFIGALGVQTSLIEQPIFVNVTPKVLTPQLTLTSENGGGLEFKGFKEYAFDKYIVFRGNQIQLVNENIKSLDDFAKVPDNIFKDQQDFVTKFVQSQQIGVAQNMANVSVTQFTLGFQPRGSKSADDTIILETSLNPYQNGVSINNFDASVYAATDDFLMTSPITSGKTLEDSMGKFPSPLGSKLISLLETLGYPTKQLPNNDFKVCNIPSPSPSPSSPSTTVTTAITASVTTQVTTTVPVVVTTTIQQDDTSVVQTQTQNIVTQVASVSHRVVTTVVVVDAPPSQPTSSPTSPFQEGFGSSSSSFKINQNNFISIIFIILIVCILLL